VAETRCPPAPRWPAQTAPTVSNTPEAAMGIEPMCGALQARDGVNGAIRVSAGRAPVLQALVRAYGVSADHHRHV